MKIISFQNLILLVIVFVQSALIAQTDSILYRTYEYPNVYRKALQLSTGLDGTYINAKGNSNLNPEKLSDFNQDLQLSYSTFKNDEKTQGESYGSFINSYSNTKLDGTKVINFGFYWNMHNLQRRFRTNNNFFEWGYNLNSSYTGFKRPDLPDQNRQNLSSILQVPLKIGKGRIQPISDVFLAKFIADELVSSGIISRQMTQSELFSFANEIAILQNQRVFDSRRYRVYVQENLSKWLENNFQTDKERTIELVNIITDNWLNAFLTNRLSGKSFSFGVTPSLQFNRNLEDGTYSNSEKATSGELEYKNELPMSQFFQRSINIRGGLTVVEKKNNNKTGNFLEPFFNASYVLGYYPNSRTTLSLGANVNFQEYNLLLLTLFQNNQINSAIDFRTSYFISNRIRITGEFSAIHSHNWRESEVIFSPSETVTYDRIRLRGNVGLSYIFF